jgi:mannose-1-phosphate guanylyltransferase
MIAVIMAGGAGTRFWPLSRENYPKQYLRLFGEKTMLRKTVERLYPMIGPESIYVVSTESQRPLIRENVPEIPEENLIIEPFGRNTAPCIALSAFFLKQKYADDETMLVLPSDHVIVENNIFLKSVEVANKSAQEGFLVTFGIKPDYPATGYGYIEVGEKVNDAVNKIKNFKEKPDYKTAKSFLQAGNNYWNSGMFMWNIGTIIDSFKEYAPDIYEPFLEIEELWKNKGLAADVSEIYKYLPQKPVDIAIMEKADKGVVVPVNYHWNDVGSWRAVAELSEKDNDENTLPERAICVNSENNYVYSKKLVSLIDIDNLIIVETDDALLITRKEGAEKVKDVVNTIQKNGWKEYL